MNDKNLLNDQIKTYKDLIKEINTLESQKRNKANKKEQLEKDLKLIDIKLKELDGLKQSMEKAFDGFKTYLSKYNDDQSIKDNPHA